jgi:ribonuclease Z
MRFRL